MHSAAYSLAVGELSAGQFAGCIRVSLLMQERKQIVYVAQMNPWVGCQSVNRFRKQIRNLGGVLLL
jgi:hypothetical protein